MLMGSQSLLVEERVVHWAVGWLNSTRFLSGEPVHAQRAAAAQEGGAGAGGPRAVLALCGHLQQTPAAGSARSAAATAGRRRVPRVRPVRCDASCPPFVVTIDPACSLRFTLLANDATNSAVVKAQICRCSPCFCCCLR
jgi:hypothetical protein